MHMAVCMTINDCTTERVRSGLRKLIKFPPTHITFPSLFPRWQFLIRSVAHIRILIQAWWMYPPIADSLEEPHYRRKHMHHLSDKCSQRCSNSSCGYAVKGLLKLWPSLIQNQNAVNENHVSIIVIITWTNKYISIWVWKMHENFTICDGRTTQIIFTVFFFIYFYLLNICEGFMDTWSFILKHDIIKCCMLF